LAGKLGHAKAAYLIIHCENSKLVSSLDKHIPGLYSMQLRFMDRFAMTCGFLGGSCEHLVRLSLANVLIQDLPPFPALSRLHLYEPTFNSRQDLWTILLLRTPRLKVLNISNPDCRDTTTDVTISDIPQVDLPLLEVVEAETGNVQFLCALIHSIPLPQQRLLIRLATPAKGVAEELVRDAPVGVRNRLTYFWRSISDDDTTMLSDGKVIVEQPQKHWFRNQPSNSAVTITLRLAPISGLS
jgi:hypothetical protein